MMDGFLLALAYDERAGGESHTVGPGGGTRASIESLHGA